ncbi:MAG: fibro-slime domain-containing protein [Fibrobacter sp.]|nr:fibro-slime domain-containing protein [Fibrobacter sp.]
MDKDTMKKRKTNLFGFVIGFAMLLAGVQGAFAAMTCSAFSEGTVYLKLPTGWNRAYAVAGGNQVAFTASKKFAGWYEISTAMIGGTNQALDFIIGDSPANDCSNGHQCISSTQMNVANMRTDVGGFSCADFNRATGELWISPNPDKATVPLVGKEPPNAKKFYLLIPNDKAWKSSVPMYSPDGTFASGKALTVDPEMCGWYYAMWLDEEPPSNMIVFMDTDTDLENAIGAGGWNADDVTPLDMPTMFSLYGSDKLYFVPDVDLWDDEGELNMGFYDHDPGVADPSLCAYSLAALLYDTDASLHGAFTCDAYPQVASNGCYVATAKYNYPGNGAANTVPCIGVTPGIVKKTLLHADKTDAHYKKPMYNAASGCFASEEAFDAMFKETPGVNFQHCRDVPFTLAKDGLWEYDSFNEPTGAFTPLNDLTDSIKAGLCTGDCATAATLRSGLGNVSYGAGTATSISTAAKQALGNVANWGAKNPNTGLPYIDSYPVSAGEFDSGTNPDVYDNTTWDTRIKGNNNQMYCFESHANFVFRPGMMFYFRGDDDIWVFIDNVLAVDLGGTHLAAPAAVNLDKFTGENGALVTGKSYDIDIFFCDRRTDMSNVRIKTNMYIQQTSGLESIPTKKGAKTEYELCYTESGDGSCAAVAAGGAETQTWCGDDIPKNIIYTIQTAKGVTIAENLVSGQPTSVYYGGIDLTHKSTPVIDKSKLSGLGPGRYNLVASVEGAGGKPVKISFKVSGNLEVLTQDGIAVDSNGVAIPGGTYKFVAAAMAEQLVPIYVSAIGEETTDGTPCDIDASTAVGQTYILNAGGLTMYTKTIDPTTGSEVYEQLVPGTSRTIPASGVDTVFVTVPNIAMENSVQEYNVTVEGRTRVAKIRFYAPQIVFVEDSTSTKQVTGDADTNELWVGSFYTYYLLALSPNSDGTSFSPCDSCNFNFSLGSQTSQGIQLQEGTVTQFINGRASVTIRSIRSYRYAPGTSADSTAILHVVGDNPKLTSATYTPLHFKEPPVPYPVLTDIFDVRGAKPSGTYNIPSPYFNENQEYLDGIGDSLTIYYNRPFHKDSLPDSVFVKWDTESCTDDGTIKFKECDSIPIYKDQIREAAVCDITDEKGETRCQPYLGIGGLALSKEVKTVGAGIVSSWASYVDKGKSVAKSFEGDITDRIAPIILSARSEADNEDGTIDKVTIILSEPAKVLASDVAQEAFSYYLNSATTAEEGAARYRNSNSPGKPQDKQDTISLRYNNTSKNNPTPHVGDYVRFRADALVWSDTAEINSMGKDTIRVGAGPNWNSPTDYSSTDRLPSPWVPVVGEAKVDVNTINFTETNPDPIPANTPVVQVYPVSTTRDIGHVKTKYPYTLGHFVECDMGALINSQVEYTDPNSPDYVDKDKVEFHYTVDYFTNLGNGVAHVSGKVYCVDKYNKDEFGQEFFGGEDCVKNPKNFYVAWNLLSDKGRLVASGAYITKYESYVKLDKHGKQKKKSLTEVWGVRRGHGRIK